MWQGVAFVLMGLVGGYILFLKYSEHATALQSAIQLGISAVWVASAIVTIAHGYYAIGAAMLAMFSYFMFNNASRVQEEEEFRGELSNLNPFGYENKR